MVRATLSEIPKVPMSMANQVYWEQVSFLVLDTAVPLAHLPQFSVAVKLRKLVPSWQHIGSKREKHRRGSGEMDGVLLVGSREGRLEAGSLLVGDSWRERSGIDVGAWKWGAWIWHARLCVKKASYHNSHGNLMPSQLGRGLCWERLCDQLHFIREDRDEG